MIMGYKEKNLISVAEAAKLLGLSRMHVVRKIKSGEIKAIRIGRAYAIDRNQLGGIFRRISEKERRQVDKAVEKVFRDYGDVIKKLGAE
jgi:excisionase family DNA binding protein